MSDRDYDLLPHTGFRNSIYRLAETIAAITYREKKIILPISYPNPFFVRVSRKGINLGLGLYIQGEPSYTDHRVWANVDFSERRGFRSASLKFFHGEKLHEIDVSEVYDQLSIMHEMAICGSNFPIVSDIEKEDCSYSSRGDLKLSTGDVTE